MHMRWPLRYRLWALAHSVVNRLAWRFGGYYADNPDSLLWRLNDWVAGHWTDWWVKERCTNRFE